MGKPLNSFAADPRWGRKSAMQNDLRRTLSEDDEVVIIYSGFWTIGRYLEDMSEAAADRVLDAVLEAVGPERTLLMPTYTFGFPVTARYDLILSKPETGVLPTLLLRRPGVHRTPKPINSYAVLGPRAEEVMGLKVETAWGNNSVFCWLEETNALQCVFGVPWKYCGYYHRPEELLQVPYRYYKKFSGTLTENGQSPRPCSETLYVRSLDVVPIQDTRRIASIMRRRNYVRVLNGGTGLVESALTSDILEVGMEMISADAFAYNTNQEVVRRWVAEHKADEIASLPPGQVPDPPYLWSRD